MVCQLNAMAFHKSWPRSCPTCGLGGKCVKGMRQEKREDGFDIIDTDGSVVKEVRWTTGTTQN